MSKVSRITLRLDEDLLERLEAQALQWKCPVSYVARAVLDNGLLPVADYRRVAQIEATRVPGSAPESDQKLHGKAA
jgi:hypothetical protein